MKMKMRLIQQRSIGAGLVSLLVFFFLCLEKIYAFVPGSVIQKSYLVSSPLLRDDPIPKSTPITSLTTDMLERNILSKRGDVSRNLFSAATASLLAGSVAGAVGVGVAFPLDTLKTKSQVMGRLASDLSMPALIHKIWEMEGVIGFFGGVKAMMVGQAVIKALAFSTNTFALNQINSFPYVLEHSELFPTAVILVIAAAISGFVTSFVVAPVERVKVMMQAQGNGPDSYQNEIECINAVLRTEGISGLMGRGLSETIAREVPSYCIYFVVYGLLIDTPVFQMMGGLAPLVGGALSGMACWIPVYPIDVVKTLVQNTDGSEEDSTAGTLNVAMKLYEEGGVGAFFDGLTPKMLRAAINHAVTFWLYDLILKYISTM